MSNANQKVISESDIKPNEMVKGINLAQINDTMKGSENLVEQASRAVCTTKEQFATCGDLVKMLRARVKAAEELRTSWTKPINDGLKLINAFFKMRSAPLEDAIEHVEYQVMKPWAVTEERRIRAEQDAERKRQEEAALKIAQEREEEARRLREQEQAAHDAGDAQAAQQAAEQAMSHELAIDAILEAPAALPVAKAQITGARGMYGATSGIKKVWKTKMVDVSKLPPAYVSAINANEKAMNAARIAIQDLVDQAIKEAGAKAVDAGRLDIPGLEITHESDINVR